MRRGRFSRVYGANHPFEAHFVRTVLESRGIWATVQNENLAPYGVGAEVWVEAAQTEDAVAIVKEFLADDGGQLSLVGADDPRGRLAEVGADDALAPARCVRCGEALDPDEPGCPRCDGDASA